MLGKVFIAWRCIVSLDPGISKTNLSLTELPLARLCAHLHAIDKRLLFTSYTASNSGLEPLNRGNLPDTALTMIARMHG